MTPERPHLEGPRFGEKGVCMSKPILAVGIDPAKRVHRAVGVLFPDEVVGPTRSTQSSPLICDLRSWRPLTQQNWSTVWKTIVDMAACSARCWTERGRDVRVVNPLWTNRQR